MKMFFTYREGSGSGRQRTERKAGRTSGLLSRLLDQRSCQFRAFVDIFVDDVRRVQFHFAGRSFQFRTAIHLVTVRVVVRTDVFLRFF